VKTKVLLLMFFLAPLLSLATTSEEYYAAGLTVMKEKDYERAIKYFRGAIEQKADYWQAYHYMGVAYYQLGNRTEAVVAMRESLKLNPKNDELKVFIGKVEGTGPWVPRGSLVVCLAWAGFILALLTAGWVGYWSWKFKPWKRG
jgi:tetratricopeptide (TPR) repeat protein